MPALLNSLPVLDKVAPPLAAEIVWRLWRTPRRSRSLTADAARVMELAGRSTMPIAGRRIATYRWGSGPRVVLLVHGWEGRASDFAPIVRELRSPERTILAVDAPGHGNSTGRRTTVIDYAEVLAEVARRHGRLEAVVSHSLGTPSAAAAASHGLRADRYVSIGGVADLDRLVPTFCEALGVRPSTAERVRARIENRVFDGNRDVWAQYSAAESPLPASAPLLVIHDRSDRMVPVVDATLLADAHGPLTRVVVTEGLGHYRILGADAVLDDVSSFLGAPSEVDGNVPAFA
ncbi:alpha/beta hydrolase [Leifsonia bigeumensis]|uniref:Alpha/beta hydrolase n=1 Tax=Leifsonella bigeumensis TaxID=433643 RepID=A0ABP7F3L6_9MICO